MQNKPHCLFRPSRLQLGLLLCAGLPATLLCFVVFTPGSPIGLAVACIYLSLLALADRFGLFDIFRHACHKIAHRPRLAVAVVGLVSLAVSIILSLVLPPVPFVMDEFAYLHASDTFAAGRLTNPTHPLWESFETLSILSEPTTSSKYPPAQGLVMALGQLLTGRPIVGVWLSYAVACASLCWMLLAWLPLRWAFLGGLVAAFGPGMQGGYFMETGAIKDALMGIANPTTEWYRFRCSWSQSYWGGAVAMLGGCLVYGALPRIQKQCNWALSATMGVGLVILANARPFEGLVTCIPAAVVMLWWLFGQVRDKSLHKNIAVFLLPITVTLLTGFMLMGIYNKAVTGNPLKMPYQLYSQEFDTAPMFVFMKPKPPVQFRYEFIRIVYSWHTGHFMRQRSLAGWLAERKNNIVAPILFFTGPLLFSLVWLPAACRRKSVAFAALSFFFLLGVHQLVVATMPHYVAPGAGLIMVVIMTCLRQLSVVKFQSRLVGRKIVLAMLALVPLALIEVKARQYSLPRPLHFQREQIMADLAKHGGQHLVMVRDGTFQQGVHLDWVSNRADIDRSAIVWARELGPDQNRKVLDYFKGRTVWLLETENRPLELKPYKLE